MRHDPTSSSGCRRLTPPTLPVGSRVYSYGGGEVVPTPDGGVFVVGEDDQRWWWVSEDGATRPVTPDVGGSWALGDGALGADGSLWCIRESEGRSEPVHEIVMLDPRLAGTPVVAVGGHDFVAAPRPSPDGKSLAWCSWEHPAMPWDESRLWVARLGTDGLPGDPQLIAGGPRSAPQQPRWLPDGSLVFLDDAAGWWLPVRWDPSSSSCRPLVETAAEFAEPPWQLGCRSFDVLAGGELLVATTRHAVTTLGVLPIAPTGSRAPEVHDVGVEATYLVGDALATRGDGALAVVGRADRPAALVRLSVVRDQRGAVSGAQWTVVRTAREEPLDDAMAPVVRTVSTPEGDIEAVLHLPASACWSGPADERPPLVVEAHGGPTSRVPAAHSSAAAFWTTRGFALLYVNYAGSSGAGRAFRERLRGQWGRRDVEDCLAAVGAICGDGLADPRRVVARGASAGGYTALRVGCSGRVRAVAAWSAVADPAALMRGTHKFESRYVEGLLGTERPPSASEVGGRARCPVLLVHGDDDEVVPVSQACSLRDALAAAGGRVALVVLEGERHCVRSPRSLRAGLEAELSLYRHVLEIPDPDGLAEPPWAR